MITSVKGRLNPFATARTQPCKQRGAALVISAIILTTILAFAALVAGRASRSELRGAYQRSEALQALLSAQSGLMRATRNFTSGTACASVGETITDYPTGVTTVTAGKTTDFSGVALGFTGNRATVTSCRIEATATDAAAGVVRKVSHIVDTSLFDLVGENGTFSAGTAGPPARATGWTYTDVVGTYVGGATLPLWNANSGDSGTFPSCGGAARMYRASGTTAYTVRAQNQAWFNHYTSVTRTVTINYRYRYLANPNDNAGNTVALHVEDGSGNRITNTAVTMTEPGGAPNPTGTPPPGTACTDGWQAAANFTTTAIAIAATNPMRGYGYTLVMDNTNAAKEIELELNSVTGQALSNAETYSRIRLWRECLPGLNNCP